MRTCKSLNVPPRAPRPSTWGVLAVFALCAGLGSPAGAQEAAKPKRTLRFVPPNAAACGVQKNIVFLPAAEATKSLSFDLYTPPDFRGDTKLGVVVFVNGVGLRELKDWPQYTGWARAMACEGLAAVTYEANFNRAADDLEALMVFLRDNQAQLSIDASNVAWWACSDNVLQALPLAMSPSRRYLRCAVFYYGMPDQWPVIRADLPLCVVKAGTDSPELNARIDRFALEAASANVDMNYIVHASARHAFDVAEDSMRTRDIIQDTLKFVRIQLSPQMQSESEASSLERRAMLAYFRDNWIEMAGAYEALAKLKPESGEAHYRLGFARLWLGEFEAAIPAFERAAELDYLRSSATYNVACCRSRLGDLDGALAALRLSFERGFENQALLREDPDLANLRGDPRYGELIKEWLEKHSRGDQKP